MDESTRLNYFEWNDRYEKVKPYVILMEVPEHVPRSNFTVSPGPQEKIHDMRGHEASFTLDEHGFAVRSHPLPILEFDTESVEQHYLPEMEKLLRSAIKDVKEICFFDWRLRSGDGQKTKIDLGAVVDITDRSQYFGPVQAVHVDQSEEGARKRASHQLGREVEEVSKSRLRIINTWRPLRHTVEDYPLAVCDGSTLDPAAMVTVDVIRRGYVGEMIYPKYSPGTRWHYLGRQTKDEVLILKMYDSHEGMNARLPAYLVQAELRRREIDAARKH